jgi:hypothetical protein
VADRPIGRPSRRSAGAGGDAGFGRTVTDLTGRYSATTTGSWPARAKLQPQTAVISFNSRRLYTRIRCQLRHRMCSTAAGGGRGRAHWFFTNDRFFNFDLVPGKRITHSDRNQVHRQHLPPSRSCNRARTQLQVWTPRDTGHPSTRVGRAAGGWGRMSAVSPKRGEPPDRRSRREPRTVGAIGLEKADWPGNGGTGSQ